VTIRCSPHPSPCPNQPFTPSITLPNAAQKLQSCVGHFHPVSPCVPPLCCLHLSRQRVRSRDRFRARVTIACCDLSQREYPRITPLPIFPSAPLPLVCLLQQDLLSSRSLLPLKSDHFDPVCGHVGRLSMATVDLPHPLHVALSNAVSHVCFELVDRTLALVTLKRLPVSRWAGVWRRCCPYHLHSLPVVLCLCRFDLPLTNVSWPCPPIHPSRRSKSVPAHRVRTTSEPTHEPYATLPR
jgi:hypothetical protein